MSRCCEPREIGVIVALPTGNPRRVHLESCPRCQALSLAYAEFLNPSGPIALDIRAADAELQRRLAAAAAHESRRGLWDRLLRPPRPAWAALAAALALVAIGLVAGDLNRLLDGRLPDGTGVVRGDAVEPGLQVVNGDTGLLATWPADAVGDRRLLVAFDKHMHEIGQRATEADSLLLLPDDPLAPAAFFQLVRLAGADTLGRSAIVAPRPAAE